MFELTSQTATISGHKRRLASLLLVPLLALSLTAAACEFHGSGLGVGLWGGGNFSHASSGFGANPRTGASIRTGMYLSAPALVTATVGEEVELKVSYELTQPKEDQFVQLSIEEDAAISMLDSDGVKLSENNGQHTFAFMPNAAGTYRLNVVGTVRDLSNSNVYKEHIYLRVVDSAN